MALAAPGPIIAEVARIARRAGAAIEAVRKSGFAATDKADLSPVTEADLAADRIIAAELAAAFPGDGLVSEESHGTTALTDATWVVDPLDGTEAFIDGRIRGYAVQIARVVGGVVTHGVVYEPAVDELFWAERGEGAWLEVGGATRRLATRDARDGLRLVTSTRVASGFREALFAEGLLDGGMFRSVGVKVGRVAQGLAEVYPATHALSVWDVAAPLIVLEEAGGRMTDLDERPVELGALILPDGRRGLDDALVATHGPTHGHWCEVLRTMRRQHARGGGR
ncbi:MAG: inositol monophosphatase family protein [Myxococcota bacterium]